uniref:Retrotransposon Copia-like N-terminal domain-containing protein n=1 Tax=Nelumbo nucifera TaxID=4432 RepID=A0A822XJ40_NELNU|nr:TPA_asm: hypothetical protein HUJ06_020248 [Nelumbo nucifera]
MVSEPSDLRPSLSMASASQQTTIFDPTATALPVVNISQLISVKLDGNNYLSWKSQWLCVLRSHQILGYIDGSTPCPQRSSSSTNTQGDENTSASTEISSNHKSWEIQDQLLMSWLLATLTDENTSVSRHPMLTRSKIGSLKPKLFAASRHPLASPPEPTCFSQAQHYPEWRTAMCDEYNALIRNGTWVLTPRQPEMNVIGCKWVFRTKYRPDGSAQGTPCRQRLSPTGRT